MKTLWSDTKAIDDFLSGRLKAEEAVLFEARLLLEETLRDNLAWQQQTYGLIKNYGRNRLKKEIQAAERKLFEHSRYESFRQRIAAIFSK